MDSEEAEESGSIAGDTNKNRGPLFSWIFLSFYIQVLGLIKIFLFRPEKALRHLTISCLLASVIRGLNSLFSNTQHFWTTP